MTSKTKVIIAGCGIAGPVLAVLLKRQGYEPIIYERLETPTESGISLCLQPNGLRVLSQIPGLVESIQGGHIDRMLYYSFMPEDEGVLSETDSPTQLRAAVGFGLIGVRRTVFHRLLVDTAEKHGVPIVWGHQLVDLKQEDDKVVVTFQNGKTDTASYTGLVQVGGFSPKPDEPFFQHSTMMNFFDDGTHLITYPIAHDVYSWATTLLEPEAKESWKAIDQEAQERYKSDLRASNWGGGVGKMVQMASRIIKVTSTSHLHCVYIESSLHSMGYTIDPNWKKWHIGRVVLIGDAAHPTSPHLGQGANQAFEDIKLLTKLLREQNPAAADPTTSLLQKIFTDFETVHIPRSAKLV
ncbi:FAD/NAD(P)-binding domain-containing protein [Panus rudis PR-1116 ss-1]|nr:FAD/NAD(P)-binding domain-containing protein [Panus rudis PR-1116 ss-1]